ncbi:transposable element Tcb1 transposase [Trichonephila clavipes]|uniref:Transposable element Tcb1 transposase n=1 Tax=Trichonephila clavipes TaxID=2585209 RepID=A0A8X6V830_TRICX|nr:transposable element Tcb1 transposase [Trichonephila clavipes]
MPLRRFQRQYEQRSQFERGRIIGMKEAGAGWSARRPTASSAAIQTQVAPSRGTHVSSRTIRRHLAEEHLGSRCPLRVLPLTSSHRRLRLECCSARRNWTTAEWNHVVFSDEARFNLSSDDNRVRVWRPCGECLNTAFDLQKHTAPTVGVIVWGDIAYNTRPPTIDP